jgi:uncharacterized membrane protein YbhN (UPF0104 family)
MSDAARKRLKAALQLLISVGLLAFVLRQIDLDRLRSLPLDARGIAALLAALLLFNVSKVAGALRLNIYQRHAGILLDARENLMLYYAGMFLNLFLPGGIGGDGYKILVLHRRGVAPVKTLLWVTLIDRISGLLILLLLGCLLLPFLDLPWPAGTVRVLAASAGLAVILVLLVAHYRLLKMNGTAIASVCAYACVVQVLQLFCMALLLYCLQVPVAHYLHYLAVFLASSLAAALPLSFGGLGARELTFLYGLQLLRLEPTQGVLASSGFFLVSVLSSLVGALFLKRFTLARR